MAANFHHRHPKKLRCIRPGFYEDDNRKLWMVVGLGFKPYHPNQNEIRPYMTVTLGKVSRSYLESQTPFSSSLTCLPSVWYQGSVIIYWESDTVFWKVVDCIQVSGIEQLVLKLEMNIGRLDKKEEEAGQNERRTEAAACQRERKQNVTTVREKIGPYMIATLAQMRRSCLKLQTPFTSSLNCLPSVWYQGSFVTYCGSNGSFWKIADHIEIDDIEQLVLALGKNIGGPKFSSTRCPGKVITRLP
ncbi:hypothetical protein STEG23_019796 [Scotinomys teguina]